VCRFVCPLIALQHPGRSAEITSDRASNDQSPHVEWRLPGNLGGDADRLELADSGDLPCLIAAVTDGNQRRRS